MKGGARMFAFIKNLFKSKEKKEEVQQKECPQHYFIFLREENVQKDTYGNGVSDFYYKCKHCGLIISNWTMFNSMMYPGQNIFKNSIFIARSCDLRKIKMCLDVITCDPCIEAELPDANLVAAKPGE